jgi:hypothetical protein
MVSVGRVLVDIVVCELDIPAIEAVTTAVRHDVARLESLVGGIANQATLSAAVDTNDGLWDRHVGTVPRTGQTVSCVLLPELLVVVAWPCRRGITLARLRTGCGRLSLTPSTRWERLRTPR